ncbi:MAG: hypothetical protein ACQES4_11960 [Bacillota bacterium]
MDTKGINTPNQSQRGNSVGNISNSAYIVMQGEWIYFNSLAEERGLYKKSLDE